MAQWRSCNHGSSLQHNLRLCNQECKNMANGALPQPSLAAQMAICTLAACLLFDWCCIHCVIWAAFASVYSHPTHVRMHMTTHATNTNAHALHSSLPYPAIPLSTPQNKQLTCNHAEHPTLHTHDVMQHLTPCGSLLEQPYNKSCLHLVKQNGFPTHTNAAPLELCSLHSASLAHNQPNNPTTLSYLLTTVMLPAARYRVPSQWMMHNILT